MMRTKDKKESNKLIGGKSEFKKAKKKKLNISKENKQMVQWVMEIQGDDFQHSLRKYEGQNSLLNSIPTMNVQL